MTPDDPAAHGRERSNTREALDMEAEEIRQRSDEWFAIRRRARWAKAWDSFVDWFLMIGICAGSVSAVCVAIALIRKWWFA